MTNKAKNLFKLLSGYSNSSWKMIGNKNIPNKNLNANIIQHHINALLLELNSGIQPKNKVLRMANKKRGMFKLLKKIKVWIAIIIRL